MDRAGLVEGEAEVRIVAAQGNQRVRQLVGGFHLLPRRAPAVHALVVLLALRWRHRLRVGLGVQAGKLLLKLLGYIEEGGFGVRAIAQGVHGDLQAVAFVEAGGLLVLPVVGIGDVNAKEESARGSREPSLRPGAGGC